MDYGNLLNMRISNPPVVEISKHVTASICHILLIKMIEYLISTFNYIVSIIRHVKRKIVVAVIIKSAIVSDKNLL